ncbi:MAG TPA: S8 family serine peptidase, partial [Candidatus Kapabacteria bacterium]|nr:S8 family serine peptidase [Candidatus Kapabacteria bacterium]
MKKRLLPFLLAAVFGLGSSNAFAQQRRTIGVPEIAKVSVEPAPKSIIVKFRSAAGMTDPKLLALLASVSTSAHAIKPVFKRPPQQGMRVQNIALDDFGIGRIVQVPLREGLSAQDAVRALVNDTAFEYAEPNYRYHIEGKVIPNDSLFDAQWWLRNIHAPEAWQVTEGDSTIKIGFVDTGVEWLHPDLVDQFAVDPLEDINHNGLFDPWPSDSIGMDAHGHLVHGDLDGIDHDGNGYANDVIGYDFVDQESLNVGDWSGRDPIPQDENGHGTAIAGILAARQNNHIGVSGIAPKCKLVALRAFDATGVGEDDDIASAIVYAADNGVRILNLSFGDIVPSLLQRDAIRYATSKGTLVFASSGNEGGVGPHYPSDFDECVSVGGTTNYPSEDLSYAFTTHGEGMDVVAPGENVMTTLVGDSYGEVSGTSASSPIAAGIAALLLSEHPDYSPLELRSVLESTTQDILTAGYDTYSANGRVDAFRALSYKGGAAIKLTSPHTLDAFHIGDTVRFMGSAVSTLFTRYTIDYDSGSSPTVNGTPWTNIASSDSQTLNGTLAAWDTHNILPGYYTVRLAVQSTDDRSTEEHFVIMLESNTPKFISFEVDTIFVNNRRGLLIKSVSDKPATLRILAISNASQVTKADDRLGLEHFVLLKSEDISSDVPLSIRAILTSPDGDSSSMGTIATIPSEGVSQVGFHEKPYSLPPGFALDTVLATSTGNEVI